MVSFGYPICFVFIIGILKWIELDIYIHKMVILDVLFTLFRHIQCCNVWYVIQIKCF